MSSRRHRIATAIMPPHKRKTAVRPSNSSVIPLYLYQRPPYPRWRTILDVCSSVAHFSALRLHVPFSRL